uniref:5'-3' exoribonuclease 1 n=1 Tax=Haemonchus contortus TaxID=6289 RepID=A0A7I4Y9R2_HAECO|nr:Putative 5-3 exonuclease domain containing protein [Haemonchus contortus]
MGVPKFYRWISERYPCLSEVISDTEIPEFDNLYLDMNGIIHNCSHPNDDDVNFRISQEQIFCDIFAYIDKLFNIIRPQKVFFLAVDGVAPRAKMNQQRARRFMSARTAAEQEQAHVRKGGKLPTEKRFDSNCITPGTVFMAELHQALSSWLNVKIDKDPLWHNIRVYLSGHDCPGEGEHKIMEFIRHERIADGYDPNTRHCMYGLDADLLMLGICSHEPHFSLLREEVKFSRPPSKKSGAGSAQRANPSQTKFHLLHLSLLREYLSWEFDPLKASLPFPYDVDRIVDDWVLMGFLVGNDFIPHLPHVHIHDDALPLLYQTYIQILPTLDGYINESGILHLKRFEVFLKAFAANDRKHFLQIMEDESYLRSKRCQEPVEGHGQNTEESSLSSTDSNDERDETTEDSLLDEAAFVSSDEEEDTAEAANRIPDGGLPSASYLLTHLNSDDDQEESELCEALMAAELREMDDKLFENDVENCWTKTVSNSFRRHKRSYYREKLQYENITKTELRQQAEGYVRAIQWNLHYYYRGCVSWNWFYPHHYSPYISDVVDFSDMDMSFELGQPFKPFEQLLAVLPTASAECLPQPLRDLMCNKESPISDFYPTDFRTDLNGKKNDWEAVVLIPFIDEKRLLSAMESKIPLLTQEEKLRNTPGNILLYCSLEATKPVLLPVNSFYLDPQKVVWGLLPNVKLDVYFPGFPTMKHLPHTAELKQINVKVFQQESKRSSMVLTIKKREEFEKDMLILARDIIDKEVCIDWPILKMAIVDSLWGNGFKYTRNELGDVNEVSLTDEEKEVMGSILNNEKERMLSRFGIDANQSRSIVFVRRFVGITYIVEEGTLRPQKQWYGPNTVVPVLLPLLVTNVTVDCGRSLRNIPVSEAYPKLSKVFAMLPSWEGFGYPALVDAVDNDGRVRLTVSIWPTVDLSPILESYDNLSLQWMSSYDAGRRIGVDGRLLSRITGTVFLLHERSSESKDLPKIPERINIGLSLKFSKRNQEVADYTRRLENGYWQYSNLCVQLLSSYRNKFRDLFAFLEKSHTPDDAYLSSDIWENEVRREERVSELKEFLSNVPTCSIEKQEGGTQYVDRFVVGHIENAIKDVPKKRWGFRKCAINPSVLYRAELYGGKGCADPDADFMLLDRVVYTLQGTTVPFGSQGTVVGLSSGKVDVLFDLEFNGGYKIRGARNSGACVPKTSLINITYGKTRKGRSIQPEEKLKRQRENGSLRAKIGKRLVAGKESKENTPSGVQKASLFGSRPSPPVVQNVHLTPEKSQQPALGKAIIASLLAPKAGSEPVTCSPQPALTGAVVSKEAVENELTSLLGIKTSKNIATNSEAAVEPPSVLKLFANLPEKVCNDNQVVSQPVLSGGGQPSAFTKLFPTSPQNQSENLSKTFSTLKLQQSPMNNVHKPIDLGTLLLRRGGAVYRGSERTRGSAIQRNVVPIPTVQCAVPTNGRFYGPNVQQTPNDPKLTDLKPSSVLLPCKKPRRRRGGKQSSELTRANQQNLESDLTSSSFPNATPPSRGFASSRAHRVRKSRLAPKFAESN